MIRNGHAGFGRGVSEKDHKAPRRGPTSADPTGEKARAVKRRYRGVPRLRCVRPSRVLTDIEDGDGSVMVDGDVVAGNDRTT